MLRLSNIVAGYGGTVVLRDVSLTVPDGRVVALLGPNGAGKSTMLKVASGLLPPTTGEIESNGRNLTRERPEAFAQAGICHIPEGRGIFRTMTVRENLILQAPKDREK